MVGPHNHRHVIFIVNQVDIRNLNTTIKVDDRIDISFTRKYAVLSRVCHLFINEYECVMHDSFSCVLHRVLSPAVFICLNKNTMRVRAFCTIQSAEEFSRQTPSTCPTSLLVTANAPLMFCLFQLRSVTDEQHASIM